MSRTIVVQDLRKTYGTTVAVDGVSFEVFGGEIFGMVGPNGAGKTTTIECVEGLRQPDRGTIRVLGLDPRRDGYALRQRIGIQLQESALPARIKVWEALDLFASFYQRSVDWRRLLEQVGLAEKWTESFTNLSGGQKQRLFIILALINDPDLVFLDELTTGLDPQARHAMWDVVHDIRHRGKTVFITTHLMEEAERLCDRVAIIDHGKIIALGTPEQLIRNLGAESRVTFSIDGDFDTEPLEAQDVVTRMERSGEKIVVYGQGDQLVSTVVRTLEQQAVDFRDLRTEQPTLEDVFLALTGRKIRG